MGVSSSPPSRSQRTEGPKNGGGKGGEKMAHNYPDLSVRKMGAAIVPHTRKEKEASLLLLDTFAFCCQRNYFCPQRGGCEITGRLEETTPRARK